MLQRLIDHACINLGKITQMNRFDSFPAGHSIQIHSDPVGKKRDDGSKKLRECFETFTERLVSCKFVSAHFTFPEALSRTSDIPVRKVVHRKIVEQPYGPGKIVLLHPQFDPCDERVKTGTDPAVEFGTLRHRNRRFGKTEPVHVRVHHKEIIAVDKRAEKFTLFLLYLVGIERLRLPWRARDHQVPAKRIGAIFFHHFERIDHIALGFRHLLAIAVEDMTVDKKIPVSWFVENQRRDSVQRIEPPACLVDTFRDKISRKSLIEKLPVFKRIVQLRKWHRTAVEPDIDQLGSTVEPFSFPNEIDAVDKRGVQIERYQTFLERVAQPVLFAVDIEKAFLEFGNRADGKNLARFGTVAYLEILCNP